MSGPRRDADFQPNGHLEVTPEFLRETLAHLRAHEIEIITIDELHQRLTERNFMRRFACFTFDDGYRDNRDFALPVMREFDAPFTMFVTSDFAEGSGRLWWIALEMVIARRLGDRGGDRRHRNPSRQQRRPPPSGGFRAAPRLAARPAGRRTTFDARSARSARVTASTRPRSAAISACPGTNWSGSPREPLVTIGAHTISHCNLAKQSDEAARARNRRQPRTDREPLQRRCGTWPIPMATAPRPARASSRWRRRRIQDRGHDAARHDLPRERRT